MKTWKLWLFSSVCFAFVGIMDIIDKKYLIGSSFIILGLSYIAISINYYKKDNKLNKK